MSGFAAKLRTSTSDGTIYELHERVADMEGRDDIYHYVQIPSHRRAAFERAVSEGPVTFADYGRYLFWTMHKPLKGEALQKQLAEECGITAELAD